MLTPLWLWGGVGALTLLHVTSTDTAGGWHCWVVMVKSWVSAGLVWYHLSKGLHSAEMKVQSPHSSFSKIILVRVLGYLVTVQAFAGVVGMGLQFFLQCSTGVEWLLSKSFLSKGARLLFFPSFLERGAFYFFLYAYYNFQVAGFSSYLA